MKKKAVHIALILLVTLVWGAVIVRAFQRPVDQEVSVVSPVSIEKKEEVASRKEFKHITLSRDPFLDGATTATTVSPRKEPLPSSKRSKVNSPHVPAVTKPWPSVTYHGIVRNTQETERRVGFLNINGKHRMLSAGEVSEGLLVMEVRNDSVVVQFDAEERSFGRE